MIFFDNKLKLQLIFILKIDNKEKLFDYIDQTRFKNLTVK